MFLLNLASPPAFNLASYLNGSAQPCLLSESCLFAICMFVLNLVCHPNVSVVVVVVCPPLYLLVCEHIVVEHA